MIKHPMVVIACCALLLASGGCSRQQSDWQKTRETNTTDAYDQFLKKYPSGEFTAQAQARVKELYEERDWQKARDADTPEAYQAFLKQYPEGKWTEEARIRVENFTLAQAPAGAAVPPNADAPVPPATQGGETPEPAAPVEAPQEPAQSTSGAARPAPVAASPTPATGIKSSTVGSGSYAIQLGAFKTGPHAAHEHWSHLQKDYPTLLAGLSSKVTPKKNATGTLYRLQATGLTEKHARGICTSLKAKSEVCVVVPPA